MLGEAELDELRAVLEPLLPASLQIINTLVLCCSQDGHMKTVLTSPMSRPAELAVVVVDRTESPKEIVSMFNTDQGELNLRKILEKQLDWGLKIEFVVSLSKSQDVDIDVDVDVKMLMSSQMLMSVVSSCQDVDNHIFHFTSVHPEILSQLNSFHLYYHSATSVFDVIFQQEVKGPSMDRLIAGLTGIDRATDSPPAGVTR